MKTVIIHGQSHKGSTYHMARLLADKIGGEITEFFFREISVNSAPAVSDALKSQKRNVRIMKS